MILQKSTNKHCPFCFTDLIRFTFETSRYLIINFSCKLNHYHTKYRTLPDNNELILTEELIYIDKYKILFFNDNPIYYSITEVYKPISINLPYRIDPYIGTEKLLTKIKTLFLFT